MKKQAFYLIVWVIIFLLTLGVIVYFSTKSYNNWCDYAYVEKVYDWDTVYTDKLGKVRLLWVDAPEIYHPGWTKVKSYKFYGCWELAKKLAEKYLYHKEILFCKDPLANNRGWYWRYLRYAMISFGDKQIPFWYILLKNGLARVYEKATFTWKSKYEQLQKHAKSMHIGIWSKKCILEDEKMKEKFLDRP